MIDKVVVTACLKKYNKTKN